MAKRRGPGDGYDFGNKRRYRRDVWGYFRSEGIGDAMLMPSIEGEEIVQALRRGWREDQLHIVDRNPAIVATLKKRFPRVHTYGVTLTRALQRAAREGIDLRYVNADLCGPITPDVVSMLRFIAESFGEIHVAITMLRGREDRRTSWWLDHHYRGSTYLDGLTSRDLSPRDHARLELALGALVTEGYLASIERTAIYRSTAGTQTMLWGILSRWALPDLRQGYKLLAQNNGKDRLRDLCGIEDRAGEDWNLLRRSPGYRAWVKSEAEAARATRELRTSLRTHSVHRSAIERIGRQSSLYLRWMAGAVG